MKNTSNLLLEECLVQLENNLQRIQNVTLVSFQSHAHSQEKQPQKKISQFGKQIKLLLDTPEEIWYCLEIHDYVKVTVQYLMAKLTRDNIQNESGFLPRQLLKFIPLANDQWKRIEKFPTKILEASAARLHESLSEKEFSSVLCPLLFLDNHTPEEVFDEFLSSRLTNLSTILEKLEIQIISESNSDPTPFSPFNNEYGLHTQLLNDSIKALCEFTNSIHVTLHCVGSLFLFYPFSDLFFSNKRVERAEGLDSWKQRRSYSERNYHNWEEEEWEDSGLFIGDVRRISDLLVRQSVQGPQCPPQTPPPTPPVT
eukprot:TRINITY_DN488_c0_g1_i5.p1 TRINITY_DN488_c0_g1~~TRINITY_DN488_c0_g1_i5.p1  ORF type:complete len:312 (-),score=72.14 TRINITY_DN488_c0_g1_i5:124-1059(-)